VKIAAGLEQFNSQYDEGRVTPANAGPTSVSSALFMFHVGREVTSEYLEADIPVINPQMGIPFVRALEFDISGRHDGYSDVGATTNPKASFNWDVVDGFRIIGNWSTSFAAQALLHDVVNGVSGNSAVSGGTPGVLPVAQYPGITQLGIPGCTAASISCNTSTLMGLNINDSTFNMKPQTGRSWTLGFKYNPSYLAGFTADVSWWHTTLLGGITAASPQTDAFNPLLNNRILLYPPSVSGSAAPCATQAQIAAVAGNAPYTVVLPSCVSVITITSDDNLIDFWASGIDATVGYGFDTDYGSFTIDDNISYETTYLQGFGENGVVPPANYRFEVRNTDGLNTAYPNIGTQMRGHLGWVEDAFSADFYVDYVGAYKNVSNSATTAIGSNSYSVYNGQGGDHVSAYMTFDLHLGYQFNGGVLGDDRLSLSVRNVLNQSPPFFNGAAGYDSYVANPLGRITELGITAKL
jgi:iron complex outermembrane receptor protein